MYAAENGECITQLRNTIEEVKKDLHKSALIAASKEVGDITYEEYIKEYKIVEMTQEEWAEFVDS